MHATSAQLLRHLLPALRKPGFPSEGTAVPFLPLWQHSEPLHCPRSKYTDCGNTQIPPGCLWKTAVAVRAMTKGLRLDVYEKDRDRGLNVLKVLALTWLQRS